MKKIITFNTSGKMRLKTLLVLSILFLSTFNLVFGQTSAPINDTAWSSFSGSSATGPSTFGSLPAAITPGSTAINVSQWNRGSGVSVGAGSGYYSTNGWSLTTGATLPGTLFSGGVYDYFTITNNATTELFINSVDVQSQISSTGPRYVAMQCQVSGGALTNFGSVVVTAHSGSAEAWGFNGNVAVCAGGTVTFYLYAWGATSAAGTLRIKNGTSVIANYANAITIGSTISNSPVTAGGTLIFTGGAVTPGVTPYTYSWSGPSSFVSTIQNPTITSVTTAAAGTYTYAVTDSFGCSVSNTTNVIINSGTPCSGTPVGGTAVPVAASFCGSGSTTINLTGGSAASGLTYQWYSSTTSAAGPFTLIPGATSASYITPTLTSTTYYQVATTCTATSSTSNSTTGTVTINPIPSIISTPFGPTSVAVGGTIVLTDTTTGYSHSWTSGTPSIATVDSLGNVTGIVAGTTNITYNITNSFGCTGHSAPIAVTVTPYVYCIPTTSSSGDGVGFNTTGSITNISSYSQLVNYSNRVATYGITTTPGATVNYTLINPSTYSTTYAGSIWVDWNQSGVFADSTSEAELSGQAITTGGGTYTGSFTVPTTARGGLTVMRVAIGETAPSVASIITNPCGGGFGSVVDFYVKVLPTITLGAVPTACLGGTAVQTIVSTAGGPTNYHIVWNSAAHTAGFTDIASTTLGSSISIPIPSVLTGFTTTTTYTGTLYVSEGAYVSTGTPISVTVNPPATVNPITGAGTFCMPATDTLSETSTGGVWSSSSLAIATVSISGIITGISAGVATISYSVTTCGSAVATKIITVNALPNAGTITGSQNICMGVPETLSDVATGGVWSSTNTARATVSASGVVTAISAGVDSIKYTVTNSCGSSVASVVVTINPVPNAGSISGSTSTCVGSVLTLTDVATGGYWHSSVPSVGTVDSFGHVTGVSSGVTTLSYIDSNYCGVSTASAVITVNALPNASTITGSQNICFGVPVTLSDIATGGVWSSTNTARATVSATGVVTAISAGVDSIKYTVANSCGSSATSVVVTINPVPNAGSISGLTSTCVGSVLTLTDVATGGYWHSSVPSVGTVDSFGHVTGVSAGVTTISYVDSNYCGVSTASSLISVVTMPSAGVISGTSLICIPTSSTLTSSVTGGVWSSSSLSIATVDTAGHISGVSAGNATITYSVTNVCGTVYSVYPVTVNSLPLAGTITGSDSICNLTSSTYTDAVSGGVWTSSNPSIASITSLGLVTAISAGTDSIKYSVTNSCGIVTAIKNITVNPLPTTSSITGISVLCVTSTVTLFDSVSGGSWTTSASAIASINSSGVVTGVSAGNAIITYTVTNLCGSASTTYPVTVNVLPVAGTISGADSICNLSSSTYTDLATGGIWISSNTSVATINSAGLLTAITSGVDTITYSVTNICGTNVTSKIITINPLAPTAPITGTSVFCITTPDTLSDSIPGGVWSSSSTSIATINSIGIVSGVAEGSATISYTVTNGCGPISVLYPITVSVFPTPASIIGADSVCNLSSSTYTDATSTGVWISSNPSVATISGSGLLAALTVGIDTITFSVTDICGTASVTKIVTIDPLPTTSSITGVSAICVGNTITVADSVSGGNWTTSSTSAIINTGGVVTGMSAGVVNISYTVTNNCGTSVAVSPITVNPLPNAGSILGVSNICIAGTTTMTDAIAGGIWSSTNPAIASITSSGIVTGVSVGIDTIKYTVTNVCGTSVATYVISVSNYANPGVISGPATVCMGSSISLADSVSGGSWSSGSTSICTVDSIGLVYGVSAGVVTITYSVSNVCGISTATYPVTVNTVPSTGVISGLATICAGGNTTLSETVTGGVWSSSNFTIATVTSGGIVTGVIAGNAIISYSLTNICGTSSATFPITVLPLPNAGTISGPNSICHGATNTLTETVSGGAWTSSNTSILTVDSIGLISGVSVGTATITNTYTNSCGTSFATHTVTVQAVPIVGTIIGPTVLCVGVPATLSNAFSGGSWTCDTVGVIYIDSLGIVLGHIVGTSHVTYTITNSCGTASSVRLETVTTAPYLSAISGPSTVCQGSAITLTDSTAGGTWSSTTLGVASVTTSGIVTGAFVGVDTIKYSVTNVCGTVVATDVISVNTVINPGIISGVATLCVGNNTSLSETVGGGTWSSGLTTIATVDSTGSVSGVFAGTTTISYSVSNICGTTTATYPVTVNTIPNSGVISGLANVCPGGHITLSESISGGIWGISSLSIATINASGVVTGVASGNDIISYTLTNSCGNSTATFPITVDPIPNAGTISGANVICQGTSSPLNETTSGGIWSSSSAPIVTVDSFGIITGVSTGIATISYMYTNSCGSSFTTYPVTINPLPIAGTIIGPANVCIGFTTTLSEAYSGGYWTADSTGVLTVDSTGVVTSISVGTAHITYTLTNSCGTASSVRLETVVPTPYVSSITGSLSVCMNATTTLIDSTIGGVWSSSNPSIASINSSGVLSGYSVGTAVISYSITNVCGVSLTTSIVTINPLPAPITGTSIICIGLPSVLGDSTLGGLWSSSNTSLATINALNGSITGIAVGAVTMTYTLGTGCFGVSTLTVNPLPNSGIITGLDSVCAGSTITLSDASAGGSWSSTNGSATVTMGVVSGVSGGADTIRYTVVNSCGTGTATKQIYVSPLPNAGIISGPSNVCLGDSILLTDLTVGGVWSTTNSHGLINNGRFTGISQGVDTVKYSFTNACGLGYTTKVVTINILATSVTGTPMVCLGSNTILHDSTAGGIWSTSSISTVYVDPSTGNCIGASLGSATITYLLPTGCYATADVTVNPSPVAITGPDSVCAGSTIGLSDIGSGIWSCSNTHSYVNPSTGVVTGSVPGVDTVIYTLGTGCFITKVITINTLPGLVTGVTNICAGGVTTMSDSVSGGKWSMVSGSGAIDSMTGIFNAMIVGVDSVRYTLTTGCTMVHPITVNPNPNPISGFAQVCEGGANTTLSDAGGGTWLAVNSNATIVATDGVVTGLTPGTDSIIYSLPTGCYITVVLTVNPLPHAAAITGADSVCVGSTITMSDAAAGGIWNVYNSNLSILGGIVLGISGGMDTVVYRLTNSCGTDSALKVVKSISTPVVGSITGAGTLCLGHSSTLADSYSGGVWSSANNSVASVDTAGIVVPVSKGTDSIFYTVHSSCGSVFTYIVVTVDSTPVVASVEGTVYVCLGEQDTLIASPSGGVWSVSNANVIISGNIVTGVATGYDTVIYNLSNSCGSTNGYFVVRIPTKGQCDSLEAVHILPKSQLANVEIYPNPNSGIFNMKVVANNSQSANVTIINMEGQKVKELTIEANNETKIIFDGLPGLYFIRTVVGSDVYTNRIVITK